MLIRVLVSVAGVDFSYSPRQVVEAPPAIAADLIKAGHAVAVEDGPQKAVEPAPKGLETPEKPPKPPKK